MDGICEYTCMNTCYLIFSLLSHLSSLKNACFLTPNSYLAETEDFSYNEI